VALSAAPASAQTTTTITAAWDRNTDTATAGYMVSYGTSSGVYQWTHDAGNQVSTQLTLTRGAVYYLVVRAYNAAAQVGPPSNEVTVNLVDVAAPTAQITATLQNPTTALVTWSTTHATTATIDGATVALSGSQTVPVTATTTFTLIATGAGGVTITRTATVTVTPRPAATFTAAPSTIAPGGSSTLSWMVSGASSISINQGVGSVASSGSRVVAPGGTTTYTLTATNAGGSTSATTVVTVSSPTSPTSPDGTTVPPAAQIVDGQGAVWTLSGGAVLRNGASAAGGTGVRILYSGGSIYVLGANGGSWWRWLGTGWTNVGTTQPGGTVTPPPPPGAASANGTQVPPAAQIVDSQGAVWTMNGTTILRNGTPAAGGTGGRLLYSNGSVYALGSNGGSWWQWLGGAWSHLGSQPPGTTTPPAVPGSPDGTQVPPAPQIVDSQGEVWTLNSGMVLRNGNSAAGGTGVRILYSGGSVYVLSSIAGSWWRWLGTGWTNVGTAQPGGTVAPPAPSGASPDGTVVPPASQIVDAQGGVWTLNGAVVFRNGIHAAGGTGFRILWLRGTIYVLGSDNTRWWRWTGSSWTLFGTTQPT
jgi:hypothetical protein